MAEDTVFLIHPDTGEVHTIKEAAAILKMTTMAVYGRIWRGETGHKLWRPKGLAAHFVAAEEKPKKQFVKCREEEKHVI